MSQGPNPARRPAIVEGARTLGRCPSCEAVIPRRRLLIKYETADGWPRMYAACPACTDVVQPR